jgi:hypothetical protein
MGSVRAQGADTVISSVSSSDPHARRNRTILFCGLLSAVPIVVVVAVAVAAAAVVDVPAHRGKWPKRIQKHFVGFSFADVRALREFGGIPRYG